MVNLSKPYARGDEGAQSARVDWLASWQYARVELVGNYTRHKGIVSGYATIPLIAVVFGDS